MKKAFTLSEVLITLGIIGVVAALTMPSLITNHQKKQTVVQLKKVYSDLSNAVRLSEVVNGPMQDWTFPSCESYTYECISPFLEQYWLPYFQGSKVYNKHNLNKQGYTIFEKDSAGNDLSVITHYIVLNNGVILSFFSNVHSGYIWLFADINGTKGPNRIGRDIFVFDIYQMGYRVKFWGQYQDDLVYLSSASGYGCSKNNAAQYRNFFCGRLIELSNWEIPANYPW